MANKVTMTICGQEYTLVADESAAYMEQVGTLVNQRMRQAQETLHVSRADAAVLAAVNLADELLKNQAAAENLRRQVKNYLDEATQAKNEASELRRQLFKAQQGRGQ
jgi:cell division protein ZapA